MNGQKEINNMVIADTDVLIDFSRGIYEAINSLRQIEQNLSAAVSVVTQMELFIGCRNKAEFQNIDKFLSRFQIVELNEDISRASADLLRRYYLSHGLLIADALIAATAITRKIPLLSKNQSDYRFIEGLELLPYPYENKF